MVKPLDEPSKLFGICTLQDMVFLGITTLLGALFINKLCMHNVPLPLATILAIIVFGPFMSYLVLKNHMPSGFFFFILKYWKKPKVLLPIAERSKIERIKDENK